MWTKGMSCISCKHYQQLFHNMCNTIFLKSQNKFLSKQFSPAGKENTFSQKRVKPEFTALS